MALTKEEKNAIREIYISLFGESNRLDVYSLEPNEKTLAELEDLLERIRACDATVDTLFKALPYGMAGGGWLRKGLQELSSTLSNKSGLQISVNACNSVPMAYKRSQILHSMY